MDNVFLITLRSTGHRGQGKLEALLLHFCTFALTTNSYSFDFSELLPENLPLRTVDLAIVGNGILGLMTAYELTNRDPNLKVAVIGPADREGGASQASGAMLGCFGEITDQTFVNDQAEKRFLMAYDAHKRWPSVIEQLNSLVPKEHQQQINQGTFVVLNPCSGQIESDSFR